MDEDDRALGSTLKRLRVAAGMTQEELAEKAGISARTVSDTERGLRALVHHDTARRLAAALGLGDDERTGFEALARGLPPPATGAPEPRLPVVPTALLGRAADLDAVKRRLQSPDLRLLTLTGPGGIGKTRLALEVARETAATWPHGVRFVSLGEVKDAALVAPELAKALGAVETGAGLQEALIKQLAGRRALVVLDTFEHLSAAVPLVYALLLGCPQTTFMVTSRSALRLRGEHEFPVPPLQSPPLAAGDPVEAVRRWPAPALFCERAQAVRPDLELDQENAMLVVDICRRLDGLPLAVELAAARVKHLPLATIRDQLDHRLELLVGGALDLPVRQRAIRDTVAWSYDLLDARAQTLLRRLAVFTGGWRLDDVEAVCGPAAELGGALEGVSALIDQSLVVADRSRPEARFDMLDVVQEYAARRLLEAGESEQVSRRHALHYLELAEELEPKLVRQGHERWFHILDIERGNLRSGLRWMIDRGETSLALRGAVALWRYWRHLGEFAEGRRWVDAAVGLPGPAPPSLRARALWAAGALAFPQGDHERLAALAAEAFSLARLSDDRMDLRNALTMQGMERMIRGAYSEALPPFREAVAICRELGRTWQLGTSYLNLGTALLHSGDADAAEAALLEGLGVYEELGDEVFTARIHNTLAHVALQRGNVAEADRLARQGLAAAVRQGERQGIGDGLQTLAAVAATCSDADRAATLAAAAAALRDTIAARPGPFDVAVPGRYVESAARSVEGDRWQRAWAAGRLMDVDSAVALALS